MMIMILILMMMLIFDWWWCDDGWWFGCCDERMQWNVSVLNFQRGPNMNLSLALSPFCSISGCCMSSSLFFSSSICSSCTHTFLLAANYLKLDWDWIISAGEIMALLFGNIECVWLLGYISKRLCISEQNSRKKRRCHQPLQSLCTMIWRLVNV